MGAPDRLDAVAADVVTHFERRREAMGGGKGMIVTVSRRVAVELYNRIAALRSGLGLRRSAGRRRRHAEGGDHRQGQRRPRAAAAAPAQRRTSQGAG